MIIKVGGWWRSVLGYVHPLPCGESSNSFLLLIKPFFDAHLSSVTSFHSSPLPSRATWATLKYSKFSFFSLCVHTYPLPERSFPSSSTPCFDLIPCVAFLCVLATGPLPLTGSRAFPRSVLQCAHPSRSIYYIDIILLISDEFLEDRAPYLAQENCSWGKTIMTHQRLKGEMPFV